MDDVVADWHSAAQEFLKMRWSKAHERIPQEDWDRIKMNSRFYRNLPLKPGAHELVQYCRDAVTNKLADSMAFLSAIPRNNDMPWAIQDKVWWAHENFEGIPVFLGPYSHDKHVHCAPGDILIDDRTSNCTEWENAGGQAHIYKNWPDCKVWLDQLFSNKS
jgi:5'(3')-deoxyribonucleotidase